MKAKRRRGSAFTFCLLLMVAMTSVMLFTIEGTLSVVQTQKRQSQRIQARLLFEGAVARTVSDSKKGTLAYGSSRSLVFGTLSTATSAFDNSANTPKTIRVDSQATLDGRTFSNSAVVGTQAQVSPWYYSLFVHGVQNYDANVTVNAPGDVYLRNSYVGGAGRIISTGDIECVGTIDAAAAGGTPVLWANEKALSFPVPNFTTYRDAPNYKPGGNNLNGAAFAFVTGKLIYMTGNVDISGTYFGNGTIFVHGKATIDGNVFSVGGKLAIIATGDVDIRAGTVQAFVYAGGEFDARDACTLTGAVVSNNFDADSALTINFDSAIWDNAALATTLKLPNHWP